jgi:hypothetical protein
MDPADQPCQFGVLVDDMWCLILSRPFIGDLDECLPVLFNVMTTCKGFRRILGLLFKREGKPFPNFQFMPATIRYLKSKRSIDANLPWYWVEKHVNNALRHGIWLSVFSDDTFWTLAYQTVTEEDPLDSEIRVRNKQATALDAAIRAHQHGVLDRLLPLTVYRVFGVCCSLNEAITAALEARNGDGLMALAHGSSARVVKWLMFPRTGVLKAQARRLVELDDPYWSTYFLDHFDADRVHMFYNWFTSTKLSCKGKNVPFSVPRMFAVAEERKVAQQKAQRNANRRARDAEKRAEKKAREQGAVDPDLEPPPAKVPRVYIDLIDDE